MISNFLAWTVNEPKILNSVLFFSNLWDLYLIPLVHYFLSFNRNHRDWMTITAALTALKGTEVIIKLYPSP